MCSLREKERATGIYRYACYFEDFGHHCLVGTELCDARVGVDSEKTKGIYSDIYVYMQLEKERRLYTCISCCSP